MSAFSRVRAQLTDKPSRIVATLLAIVLSVGFASAAVVFSATFQTDLAARIGATYRSADVIVSQVLEAPAVAADIERLPGVAAAQPLFDIGVEFRNGERQGHLALSVLTDPALTPVETIADGRLPAASHEIVITTETAKTAGLAVGDTIALIGDQDTETSVTVTGMVTVVQQVFRSSWNSAIAAPELFTELNIPYAPYLAVATAQGAAPAAVAAAIRDLVPDALVRTGAEQVDLDVASLNDGATVLTGILLIFAAIAMLVSALVITNTFNILLTARRRQIALLRCVGATAAQVRREILLEAAAVGVVGAVLGAAVGVGVGAVVAELIGFTHGGVAVPAAPIAVLVAIGVAITVAAGTIPAGRAVRTPPTAALRAAAEPPMAPRAGRLRLGAGLLVTALGGAVLAVGVSSADLLTAVAGGGLSSIGVLLLTRSFLPPLLRLAGRAAALGGTPGTLAAANAVRHPARSAATSSALIVGVGLIVMLQVAAASVGTSMEKAVADRYPVDIAVIGSGEPLPGDLVAAVEQINELDAVVTVSGVPGTVDFADADPDLGVGAIVLLGVPDAAVDVVRGGTDRLFDTAADHPTALVPAWWVGNGLVQLGDPVTVTVNGTDMTFTAAVGRLNDVGVFGDNIVVPEASLRALAPDAAPVAVWAAAGDITDAAAAMGAVNDATSDREEVHVLGNAAERVALWDVLNTVTLVATGLLAVAVVIATVGVGNTLGLSVLERTRESGLLRALGLRRGQLRLMLAIEALLLSLVGALVGLLIGLIYGWAGAATAFADMGRTVILTVPWTQVGLVLVLTVAAGVLASLLPARRAARVTPVAALAVD